MRHVGPTRVELGTRTIFNLVGPLSNPAGVKRQLVGVFDKAWLQPLAEALGRLGTERAWIVHGAGGLDEISTAGASEIAELKDGKVTSFAIAPEDIGLRRVKLSDIKGGDPQHNAEALRGVLAGKMGAYRDIVVLNAAAALVVAGRATDLKVGAALAAEALDRGLAAACLDRLIAITNTPPPPPS
jgi:anthranilate phosphoribosyltransferase